MINNWGSYVIDWVFTSMDLTAFELFDCVFITLGATFSVLLLLYLTHGQ